MKTYSGRDGNAISQQYPKTRQLFKAFAKKTDK